MEFLESFAVALRVSRREPERESATGNVCVGPAFEFMAVPILFHCQPCELTISSFPPIFSTLWTTFSINKCSSSLKKKQVLQTTRLSSNRYFSQTLLAQTIAI